MNYKLWKFDDLMKQDRTDDVITLADNMIELDFTKQAVGDSLDEYFGYVTGYEDLLRKASILRKEHLVDVFNEHDLVEIDHQIDKVEHRKFIASIIVSSVFSYYKREQGIELIEQLNKESIETGYLTSDVKVFDKTFRAGSKITRLFNYFADKTNDHNLKTRLVGNFQAQKNAQKVFLSYSAWGILEGGLIGESCMSPEGENQHGTVASLGYKNMFIAMSEEMDWRAWVFVDTENKKYNIAKGYPRENYEAQHAVMTFMREKGYEITGHSYFSLPEYHDQVGIFPKIYNKEISERVKNELDRLCLPRFISFDTECCNRDAYHSWESTLNDEFIGESDSIVTVYCCENCGMLQLSPFDTDGLCYDCENVHYCDECGDRYWDGDGQYFEDDDQYLCDHCANERYDDLAKTVRLEKTAFFMYQELGKLVVENGGDEQDFTAYYEELDDSQRYLMLREVAMYILSQNMGLYNMLGWSVEHNKPTDKNREVAKKWNVRIDLQNKVWDYYENTWLEGEVEV